MGSSLKGEVRVGLPGAFKERPEYGKGVGGYLGEGCCRKTEQQVQRS